MGQLEELRQESTNCAWWGGQPSRNTGAEPAPWAPLPKEAVGKLTCWAN